MTDRASEDALAALHTQLADELARRIREGEPDKDGEIVNVSAATLNVARQFLKDNDIKALPAAKSPVARLGEAVGGINLPFEGDGATAH